VSNAAATPASVISLMTRLSPDVGAPGCGRHFGRRRFVASHRARDV